MIWAVRERPIIHACITESAHIEIKTCLKKQMRLTNHELHMQISRVLAELEKTTIKHMEAKGNFVIRFGDKRRTRIQTN